MDSNLLVILQSGLIYILQSGLILYLYIHINLTAKMYTVVHVYIRLCFSKFLSDYSQFLLL